MINEYKPTKSILIFNVIQVAATFLLFRDKEISVWIANAIFCAGLFNVFAGLACIVRNGGLFKSLSSFKYRKYKKEFRKGKDDGSVPADTRAKDFTEFVMEKYDEKWNSKPFFVIGTAFILVNVIILAAIGKLI